MCGIAGLLNFGNSGIDRDKIQSMTDALAHRGPNGEGIYINGRVGLGHRRLSIFDLSDAGRQPMASPDGRYHITYNGEVYNWIEIRQQLKFNQWKSKTDTETILQSYIERGADCLQLFNGMFAFAIWDNQEQKLFAARDRVGVKPFYYGISNGGFYFASELKAFFAGGFPKKINYTMIYDFLRWGLIDHSTATFFENIVSLEPGNYMTVDKDGNTRIVRYWDLVEIVNHAKTIDTQEAIEQYQMLLGDAINLRMRADVPVGAFLSGGIDSSILVSWLAKHYTGGHLQCYTYEFDTGGAGEGLFAQEVAQSLGLTTNISTLGYKEVPEYFKKVLFHEEMPVTSLRVLSAHKLYEEYKDGATVILEGHGGDHVGGGFEYYFAAYILDTMEREGTEAAQQEFHKIMDQYGVAKEGRLSKFFNCVGAIRRVGSSTQDGTPFVKTDCLDQTFLRTHQSNHVDFRRPFRSHLLNAQYIDTFHHNLPRVLRYADRGSMAVGRETRVPMLDYRILELGFKSSEKARVFEGQQRYFMRQAAKNLLPENILNRPKRSIVDPQRRWLQHELRDWVQDLFRSNSFKTRGIFNQEQVIKEYERYCREEKPVTGFHIFQYINMELWFQTMIDGPVHSRKEENSVYEQV
ncbi:MAG: asparagine synthase (glutamine-hydrolyzing) [Candidatus Omnitrophica bacterium]|nr:asparagine synthase (glutamine-hydrolyzing) [Candidatus Omnitrophota bacterium]